MSEDRNLHDSSPTLTANVGGVVVAARSVSDAAVLNLAGDILNEVTPKRHDPALLLSMATLLNAYGLSRAAKTLRERSTKG
jgi:hypothetical protein